MRVIDDLGEALRHLPKELADQMREVLAEVLGLSDIAGLTAARFSDAFGWPIYLVEDVADLSAVRSFDDRGQGRSSLLDAASGWFDRAEWIDGGAFAVFLTVENADGGPQFVVPRAVAVLVPNVGESIRLKGA